LGAVETVVVLPQLQRVLQLEAVEMVMLVPQLQRVLLVVAVPVLDKEVQVAEEKEE